MGLTDYSRMDKEFFESGVRAERERIIELLENRMILAQQQSEIAPDTYQGQHEKESAYIEISNARWAIAIIKGEK